MKKFLTLLFLASSAFLVKAQDTIPNHSFESWTSFGTFEEPDGWVTSNIFLAFFGVDTFNVSKTTDAYSGTYAIKLESFTITDSTGTQQYGAIAISTDLGTLFNNGTPGFSYSQRATKLKGYYKAYSSDSDTSTIGIIMSQWNAADDTAYAIGVGMIKFTDTSTTYQPFEVPLIYDPNFSGNPDTVMIFMASSGDSIINGGVLIVDDLVLEAPTGITPVTGLMDKGAYPNPASDRLFIHYNLPEAAEVKIDIYNAAGQLMRSYQKEELSSGIHSLEIAAEELEPGIYIYKISAGNRKSANKFIIARP